MKTQTSDYTAAPACILLATACCVCGRPLLRGESVRTGIGPDCAEKNGVVQLLAGTKEESEANRLVYEIAAIQKSDWNRCKGLIAALRALPNFGALADKIAERLTPKPAKVEVMISLTPTGSFKVVAPYNAAAVADFKAIPGRKFAKEANPAGGKEIAFNTIPTVSKRALWNLLNTHYAGLYASAPDGSIFEIKPA